MDLTGPGTSLFQGNELANFDISQREEEEAIEEQRKRDLELKNMLENAFDDVSFDNDEGSVCNVSQNQSNASHSAFHSNNEFEIFKEVSQNKSIVEFDSNSLNNFTHNFNTPLKHTTNNPLMNRIDFNSDSKNYSDQCRKRIQNGTLHDVVDASGGGGDGDVQPSLHYKHCIKRSPMGEICNGTSESANDKSLEFTENAYDSSEQLKILYDVRVREVHRLTELIDSIRNEHEIEIKDLKHQMALLLAEKERINISHSQLQNLLVSSKQETEEVTNELAGLKKANKELETQKNELTVDLDTSKLTIDNLQRKILILEKGSRDKSELVQYELNMKTLTEKHNLELENVRKELDKYARNYEILLKENEELKLKVSSLSKINDENLAKKSEIISRLSKQIDETQKQCESFMKSSTSEDHIRLQTELKILKEEKSVLTAKLENLEKENAKKEEELKQFESFDEISSFNHSDLKNTDGSCISTRLREELCRSLKGLKLKRQEISDLKSQLQDKNEKIMLLTESEISLKKEIVKLKDEIQSFLEEIKSQNDLISKIESENRKLQNCITELKKEVENIDHTAEENCKQLEKENEVLKDKVHNLEKEKLEIMSSYSEEYMRFHNSGLERVREETEKHFKLEVLKKDLEIENLKKEVEDVKTLYVEVYNAKENLLMQFEKEKNTVRNSTVDVEEVKRLQKELDRSRQRILELDQTLKQQYQQEVEILNLDINHLNLQIEKIKKEKDLELAEKDKISVENELLKSEIEQVTSEKNLYFLKCDKLEKEIEIFCRENQKVEENFKRQLKELTEKHESDLQNISSKYEIKIRKLKKEIEITLKKNVKYDSKLTSPIKNSFNEIKDVAVQGSPVSMKNQSTSPFQGFSTKEVSTSPISEINKNYRTFLRQSISLKDIGVLTDPEPQKMSKKEVVEIMEKLGHHHEEEMKALESKYHVELVKFDKKFQIEVDKAKELIQRELKKEHMELLEQLEEKHRIELENRIEQEKKEAVVDLITEWACEVQGLKVAYAEAQAEMEKMKLKYKAAKSVALQYKTYFKSKAEDMKEEWKRIEDGYERALKELEKNVNILVDVKEDEVKARVDSITKIYEQKICKMKEKLLKCEGKLKAERGSVAKHTEIDFLEEKLSIEKELGKLAVPHGNLYDNTFFADPKRTKGIESLLKKRGAEKETKLDVQNGNSKENLKNDRDRKNR